MKQRPIESTKNILVLPRWYPNETDIQLGIFIQRQIALMAEDFQFNVVYVQQLSDLSETYRHEQKSNLGFNEHIVYFKAGKGLFRKITNFRRYRKAQNIGLSVIKGQIDLCHIHVPYRSAMPALALKKHKSIPFVITEHWSGHLNGLYRQKNFVDKWLYKSVLKKSAAISTVSEALCKAFEQNTGFGSVVIPNYIERKTKPKNTPNSNTINILSVGDFHDSIKNFSGLLHTFKKALDEIPTLQLTLIGGGPDFDKITALAEMLELNNNVHFTGRQNHEYVLEAMHNCDFYICNSRHETFGMTVAEAIYCGKPVISTRCGGPEEFVNAINGLLIDPVPETETPMQSQLYEAIKNMSETFETYDPEQMSTELEKRFGAKTIREKWRNFYLSV